MRIKYCQFFILVAVISMPARSDHASDAAALREIKLELWPAAYRDADSDLLARLLAPEFQSIDANGAVSTRDQEIDYVRSKAKDPETRQFRYEIERLELLGAATAIVTGLGCVSDRQAPTAQVIKYRSSNIFVKRNGKWLAVASQVSRLAD